MADIGDEIAAHLAGLLFVGNIFKGYEHHACPVLAQTLHRAAAHPKRRVLRPIIAQVLCRARHAVCQRRLDCVEQAQADAAYVT